MKKEHETPLRLTRVAFAMDLLLARVTRANCWSATFVCLLVCSFAINSPAQTLATLASFSGLTGSVPEGNLVLDKDGNFYGTTFYGGANTNGTVFKMTLGGTLTTLYNFCSQAACADGGLPQAGLIQATDGNLYGVTGTTIEPQTYGTVFKITPSGDLTTLYTFCPPPLLPNACVDGLNPNGLIQATDGNLYGTTSIGGGGTIFKITLGGALTTLYTFCSQNAPCLDGSTPSGLIQASDGNFYGTTFENGANSAGTVFRFTPSGVLTTLYNFCSQPNCSDGQQPSGLIQASDGNFYGTTPEGGNPSNEGTLYRITPGGALTTLYRFCSQLACPDGLGAGSLTQATDGYIYGTTRGGGANDGGGTIFGGGSIFRMTLGGALTTIYSFCADLTVCSDGKGPGALLQGSDGNLYGTTEGGGADQDGTVFKLTLAATTAVPAISANGVISASGFGAFTSIAPGTFVEIYGSNLAVDTRGWAAADFTGVDAPVSLDGASVSIGGQTAFVNYISPGQVNVLAPSNLAIGPQFITVTSPSGTSATSSINVNALEPGLLAVPLFDIEGMQYTGALNLDGTYVLPTNAISGVSSHPANPGDIIVLYGVGFGPVTPDTPAGKIAQVATSLDAKLEISIGGAAATVEYAGLAPGFTGLYQINVTVPNIPPTATAPLTFTLNGVPGTQMLYIAVGN